MGSCSVSTARSYPREGTPINVPAWFETAVLDEIYAAQDGDQHADQAMRNIWRAMQRRKRKTKRKGSQ